MFAALVALSLTLPPPITPTVTFTASNGQVEVAGSIPRWLNFTATAAEAKVTDGWLVLAGTEDKPVVLLMPQHPDGQRMYLVRRIEVRLCDGLVKCPAGPPTVYLVSRRADPVK